MTFTGILLMSSWPRIRSSKPKMTSMPPWLCWISERDVMGPGCHGKMWENHGKIWKNGYGWKWMENMLNTMKTRETRLYYRGFSWIYHCKKMKIHSKTMTIIENCWAYLFAFRIKSSIILS